MAHQYGVCNVVAALGTSFTPGHARILRRYAKRVVLVFDSDVAGISAAERALEVCLAEKIDIRLAFVPEGKDPCDFLIAAGADAFRTVLDSAVDVMEYAWKGLSGNLSGDHALSEKTQIIEKFLTTIASALVSGNIDGLGRAVLTARLGEMIGLSQSRIDTELARLIRRKQRPDTGGTPSPTPEEPQNDLFAKAQREIIEVLLRQPDLFGAVEGQIAIDVFGGNLRAIAEPLFGMLAAGQEPTLALLLGQIEQPQAAQELMQLDELSGQKGDFPRRLSEAIETIRLCQLKQQTLTMSKTIKDDMDDASLQKIHDIIKQRKNVQWNPGIRVETTGK
jgi:DNA primase